MKITAYPVLSGLITLSAYAQENIHVHKEDTIIKNLFGLREWCKNIECTTYKFLGK